MLLPWKFSLGMRRDNATKGVFFFWNTLSFGDLGRTRLPGRVSLAPMEHILSAKAVVGTGDGTILLEVKGNSVRIKRRGAPDLFVPLEVASEVGRFLQAAAAPPAARGLARA
jgi:hypothetical protein